LKKQSQFIRIAYCVMVLSFPWKRESSLLDSYGFRIECGMTDSENKEKLFEKTKPI